MIGNKEKFSTIMKIDGGFFRFGDNAKREVVGFRPIEIISS